MPSLKDEAKEYTPQQVKNIADLEVVRTDLEITEETFGEGDDAFTVKVAVVDDEKYRVPVSVLKNLKAILEVKPDIKTVKVQKTGEGMNTSYTVIPLE